MTPTRAETFAVVTVSNLSEPIAIKKAVWIAFAAALVLVNGVAELLFYFTGFNIVMLHRISLILGITMIASIFVGTILLIGKLEEERPLSGRVKDTLGADKKEA
jgi:hypothetical protein